MGSLKTCSPESCKFFYTRTDSTPIEFVGLFEAAMMFRECRLDELADEFALYWRTLPFWTVMSYKAAERAFRIVEAENVGKDPTKPQNDMTITRTKSTVFADIEAAKEIKRTQGAGADFAEVEKVFELNPEIADDIFEFMKAY